MSELTAVILCGGKGERLKPFTDQMPKALVPLASKPLLYHLMNYLSLSGVSRFVLCVGYKAECIEQFVRESAKPSWDVVCVNSGDASMADRLLDARPHIPGQTLICYGDILANVNLAALESEHRAGGALATLTVYPLHSPFGIISFDHQNRVTELAEKPVLPYWINIGFMLCEPAAFQFLQQNSDMMNFSASLAEAKALFAYRHQGRHLTINTEKERIQAEAQMINFAHVMDCGNYDFGKDVQGLSDPISPETDQAEIVANVESDTAAFLQVSEGQDLCGPRGGEFRYRRPNAARPADDERM